MPRMPHHLASYGTVPLSIYPFYLPYLGTYLTLLSSCYVPPPFVFLLFLFISCFSHQTLSDGSKLRKSLISARFVPHRTYLHLTLLRQHEIITPIIR